MYEVEVKAKLRNRKVVMVKLQALGCKFSKELHQVDHIFIPEGVVFPPPVKLHVGVLRVRKSNEKYYLTLKIPQNNRQDSIERELEIMDGEKMIDILKLLKYKEVSTVDKKRIKTSFNGITIVLDTVKDLGEFIEAERIVQSDDHKKRKNIQDDLITFLETLGVPREDQVVDEKYDIMLFNKIYNK